MLNQKVNRSSITENGIVMNNYFREIIPYGKIDPEKEFELVIKYKSGDMEAREKLILSNLRFVVSVANQHKKVHPEVPLPDLINAGNLGLMKAIDKFDETRGFKVITCAVSWIKQSMIELTYSQYRTIKLPYNAIDLMVKVNRASLFVENQKQRNPTIEEISEVIGVKREKVLSALIFSKTSKSLDEKLSLDGDLTLHDVLEDIDSHNPEKEMEHFSLNKNVHRILSILSSVQKEVIMRHYGIGYEEPSSLYKIGKDLGLPVERVENIKTVAFKKIRLRFGLENMKKQVFC